MLKNGKNYTININNTASASDFTVTISQDNWVYAPNGGIRTGVQNFIDNSHSVETYIPNTSMCAMIDSIARSDSHMGEYWTYPKEGDQDNESPSFLDLCKIGAQGIEFVTYQVIGDMAAKGLELNYEKCSKIIDAAGNISYILSFIDDFAMTLDIADAAMFLGNASIQSRQQELNEALINGKYNICISTKIIGYQNVGGFLLISGAGSTNFKAWANHQYINKYASTASYIRCQVETFKSSSIIIKKQDDGTWAVAS